MCPKCVQCYLVLLKVGLFTDWAVLDFFNRYLFQSQFKDREATLTRDHEKINQKYGECQAELKTLLLEKAAQFSKSSRERCNNNKLRLGQYITKRSGTCCHSNHHCYHGNGVAIVTIIVTMVTVLP